jgi:hypothetical protein
MITGLQAYKTTCDARRVDLLSILVLECWGGVASNKTQMQTRNNTGTCQKGPGWMGLNNVSYSGYVGYQLTRCSKRYHIGSFMRIPLQSLHNHWQRDRTKSSIDLYLMLFFDIPYCRYLGWSFWKKSDQLSLYLELLCCRRTWPIRKILQWPLPKERCMQNLEAVIKDAKCSWFPFLNYAWCVTRPRPSRSAVSSGVSIYKGGGGGEI